MQRQAEEQRLPIRERQGPKITIEQGRRKGKEESCMPPGQWKAYMSEMFKACGQNFKVMCLCVRHALLRAPSEWGGAAPGNN